MTQYNVINAGLLASGQPEDISQVLANFNAIKAIINALKDDNIDPAAAIAIAKLAGYPADATKALFGDGTWKAAGITKICDLTLGASQASFDTNTILGGNIPAIYSHLFFDFQLRTDRATLQDTGVLNFNGDTAANYDLQRLTAEAAVASATETFATATPLFVLCPGATAAAGLAAAGSCKIPNYAGTIFNKAFSSTFTSKSGVTSSSMDSDVWGSHWRNTAAINRIVLTSSAGANWIAGSRFSLYGY